MKNLHENYQKLKILRKNIRNARLAKNYSQAQVAMEMGLSQNAYSKIELGQTKATVEIVLLLSDILEVSFYELMYGII